jgi:hypothetical protein
MTVECAQLTIHSFKNIVLTLDGRRVTGLWEGDDAVVVERDTELGTPLTGADGSSVVSVTADESARLTIKLMPNSPMNQYLQQRSKAVRMGSLKLIAVGLVDTTTGEGGGCSAAVIIQEPSKSFGAAATEREWVLFCNCWQENDTTYAPVA